MQLNSILLPGPGKTAVITRARSTVAAALTAVGFALQKYGQPADRDLAIGTFQLSPGIVLHRLSFHNLRLAFLCIVKEAC